MKISDLLAVKGDAVEVVAPDAHRWPTSCDASPSLGSVRSWSPAATGRVDGIVSERDVVRLLAATGSAALGRTVARRDDLARSPRARPTTTSPSSWPR